VFAKREFDLGKFNTIQHGIDTGTNRPVKQRIRRTPLGFAGEEEAQLKKMLGAGGDAELASSLEYHIFPAKVSRHSSTRDNGNTSLMVRGFPGRYPGPGEGFRGALGQPKGCIG
jgi:hypothetical protein